MTTTALMNELAKEYLKFKNLEEDETNFSDHLQSYESLTNKIEQAGTSFYDVAVYAQDTFSKFSTT